MINLQEIKEEELNEYINSIAKGTEYENEISRTNKLINRISGVEKDLNTLLHKSINIKEYVSDKQIKLVGEESISFFPILNRINNSIEYIITGMGCKNDYSELLKMKAVNTTFSEENGILHIRFDELIPKRLKDKDGKSITNHKLLKERFIHPFLDYFKNKKFLVAEDKAVICFIHHFTDEHLIKDHDNFETKFLIDLIAINVLTDDSAKYCSHYMDYEMGEKEFSEIYVVPESKFIQCVVKPLALAMGI